MSGMRLQCLAVVGAAVSAALYAPIVPAADSFAAGVLSCAAESDRDRRLECYDRAVASYTAGLSNGRRNSARASGAVVPAPGAGMPGAFAPGAGANPAAGGTVVASAPAITSARPGTGSPDAPTLPTSSTGAATTDGGSAVRHVAARIVNIDHFPDYVVVHLDNQQSWKQVSDSPGGLLLRTGDAVTVDKQLGSYWLAGPKGEAVQVKLETARP